MFMTVDQAIKAAVETVKQHFGGADHRLEEVEIEGSGGYAVTVSFRPTDAGGRPLVFGGDSVLTGFGGKRAAIGVDTNRTYKDVIFGPNGEVKAMRMRQIVVG